MSNDPGGIDRRRALRGDILLALGILLLAGPLVQEWFAQNASRYALSAAVVEYRSLELDAYARVLSIDRATFRGHTYSDKAPYQALLAAPFLEAYVRAGGKAYPVAVDRTDAVDRLVESTARGLWWVTLWSSTIPAMALAIVIRRTVAQIYPERATVVAVAMAVGTLVLPFSSILTGHVMAALWVAGAWHVLRGSSLSTGAAVGAGVLLGAAIGTDYPTALIAMAALVLTVFAHGLRRGAWLSVGTVLGTLPLLLYNWLVFANPFEVSYQGHLPNFQGDGALGVYNLTPPKLHEVTRALVGSKGLLALTPVMLLAFAGCWYAISRVSAIRRDAVFALVGFVGVLAVSTGIDGIGGDSPGPRYLIPVLPLFALPLAEAWRRLPFLCTASAVIGAGWMLLAAATVPLASRPRNWLQAAADLDFTANVITGQSHTWVLLIPTAGGLAVLLYLCSGAAHLAGPQVGTQRIGSCRSMARKSCTFSRQAGTGLTSSGRSEAR